LRVEDVTIGEVPTVVREAGPEGEAEAVVFVHGNPGSGEDWEDLLAAVGEDRRAIAADMPGYGRAGRPRDFDYTVPGYAAFLDKLLEQRGVERAHLVLHDFGGPWGLTWAADHPERVSSLVLLNMGVLPGFRWHRFARLWRTPILGELSMAITSRASVAWLLNLRNPAPMPDRFVDRVYRDLDAGHKRAVLRLYRATELGPVTTELGARLADHRLPALVLWGDDDPYVPVSFAERQHDFFDAEVHRLPNCGHWPMFDAADEVRERVVRFLRGRAEVP